MDFVIIVPEIYIIQKITNTPFELTLFFKSDIINIQEKTAWLD